MEVPKHPETTHGEQTVTTQKVYLLTGRYHDEADVVLSVHASKESADHAKDKCEAHKAIKPKPTGRKDDPDGSKWWAARDEWIKKFPVAEDYDYYSVEERELLP